MPPLVRKASAIAFQEFTVSPAEDQRSERSATTWRRAGPGSSGHCGIPASRIQVEEFQTCTFVQERKPTGSIEGVNRLPDRLKKPPASLITVRMEILEW